MATASIRPTMLRSTCCVATTMASHYTEADRTAFVKYLEGQLAKINDLPNADTAFLRERMLEMYANPAINQLSVV